MSYNSVTKNLAVSTPSYQAFKPICSGQSVGTCLHPL